MKQKPSSRKSGAKHRNGKDTPANKAPKNSTLIVGVGASAGGLEAITDLLRHLPSKTGMAYVLVQHMAPQHESALPELLSKATHIPVNPARHGMPVERDHIYVIPPNTNLAISNGVLQLAPRPKGPAQHLPIDHFLCSLAEDQKGAAIGVILSGTASDGSLGIKAIKAEGGITFAQDEGSAKFHDMPRHAIATGYVDFILPPREIAAELARIAQHPDLLQPEAEKLREPAAEGGTELDRVFRLLRAATGVDFSNYRDTTIKRRIKRRMVLLKISRLADYIKHLGESPEEIAALYDDILIPVTGFFRDPKLFDALTSHVFAEMLRKRPPDLPVRVWVAGCSTGEEAYSLAICLAEFLGEKAAGTSVQIFATDINQKAIEKARGGYYQENITVEVSPERLRRFFVKGEDGYRVSKSIREMCIFAKHDVTKDPPFSKLDILSCRNLLIYMRPVLQKRLMPVFHYALRPAGFLLLGSSEAIGPFVDLFSLVDKKNKIYLRKSTPATLPLGFPIGKFGTDKSALLINGEADRWPAFDLQKETDRVLLGKFAPAGVVIDENLQILEFRGRTGRYLESPAGGATHNLLKMARESFAFNLRSLIAKAKGEGKSARQDNLHVKLDGQMAELSLEVVPIKGPVKGESFFLVLFKEQARGAEPAKLKKEEKPLSGATRPRRDLELMKRELDATRKHLQILVDEQQTSNEELRSANEEILSSNEELQSSNEELETAKEEVESSNEELTTLNEELQNRNLELNVVNSDLINLLGSARIPILIVGSDLRIRRFTPLAQKVFNVLPTDVGRLVSDLRTLINVTAAELKQWIQETIDTVSVKEHEVQDMQGHWFSLHIRPYKNLDNKIDGAVLTVMDIHALKHSLREHAELLDLSSDGIFIRDLTERITYWSQGAERLYGWTAEETVGKYMSTLLPPEAPLPIEQIKEGFFREGNWIGELIRARKDGAKITVLSRWTLRRDEEGKPLAILEISTDITERKRKEEELRASEERYRELFEGNLAGIARLTLEGRILECNESFARILGFASREEALAHAAWEMYLRPTPFELTMLFEEKGTVSNLEAQLRREDGSTVVVLMSASLKRIATNGPPILEGTFLDITERKRTGESLRELSGRLLEIQDEERQRLARDLHDTTNSNLVALAMNLSVVEKSAGSLDPESQKALHNGLDMAKQCLRDVRTIAYLLHPPLMHELGLAAALRWYVEGFAERSGVRVDLELPSQIGHLPRDVEAAVFRVVQEGLSNVHRHSGSPTARVSLSLTGDQLAVEIKDKGRGIARHAAVGKDGGPEISGMGITGMRERLKIIEGDLKIDSSGKGTTVKAILPLGKE